MHFLDDMIVILKWSLAVIFFCFQSFVSLLDSAYKCYYILFLLKFEGLWSELFGLFGFELDRW